jgi:hypothetical protein
MLIDPHDPRRRPITAQSVRDEIEVEERRKQEEAERPIREAESQLIETHRKLYELQKKAVAENRPDPEFQMPERIKNRRMTVGQAKKFIESESKRFVAENPDYYPCDANLRTMSDWIYAQGIQIEDAETLTIAFDRCKYLGLLVERPEPEPQALPAEPETVEPTKQDDGLVDGFDEDGNPIRVSQATIWKMSSSQLKSFYRMWVTRDGTDRRPRINKSMYV